MSDDKILVTGANGQLGAVLIPSLCEIYGAANVIASDVRESEEAICQFELLDATDGAAVLQIIKNHRVTQIYHLAAILSAKGEENPLSTWNLNTTTFFSILEAARATRVSKLFFPSSIAVFGDNIDRQMAPQEANLTPATAYGMSKAASENWSGYYFRRYGLDVRSLRYPGIVGYQSLPGGGTTDYAVDIYHKAVRGEKFHCFLREDTTLPMIYMDDAITATLQLMEAPKDQIKVRTAYNLAGMSFSPKQITAAIRVHYPGFKINYEPDFRQQIADSWPMRTDDSAARNHWGWKPRFDLTTMTAEMIRRLEKKYQHLMAKEQ